MKSLIDYGISREDRNLLLQALYNGAVNLLTGAGVSNGALGGDAKILTDARGLARELNDIFKLNNVEPDSGNLSLVYGDIYSDVFTRPRLAKYLRDRFTECKPTWQSKVFSLPWKQIWTLNVDDILKRARPADYPRVTKYYSWNDPLQVRNLELNELHVVHLHGQAERITDSLEGIIFSLQEYATLHEVSPGWHSEFRSQFVKKPFVICGSGLRGEYDLATVLSFGNRSRERGGCPSIIVLREFAPGEVERFRKQGLVPVTATGEEFFTSLFKEYQSWVSEIRQFSKTSHESEIEMASRFQLLDGSTRGVSHGPDYYSVAEAQWRHILWDLDARMPSLPSSIDWLMDQPGDSRMLLITGGWVSGKSTYALRVTYELTNRGIKVWSFRGEDTFEADLVLDYLSASGPTVLLFDDCADYSKAIAVLFASATARNIPVKCIATTERRRQWGVRVDWEAVNVRFVELDPMRKEAFTSIFNKRNEKGRLGRCTDMPLSNAWKEFRERYGLRFLEWLESLEAAVSYQRVIQDLLQDNVARDNRIKRLVSAAAAVHRFGLSLPFELADIVYGKPDFDKLLKPQEILDEIAYLDDKGLRLRSRSFSLHLWRTLSIDEKYTLTNFISKEMAPLVTPQAIERRTYPYRILRELMDCAVVRDDTQERAEEWYGGLLPQLGWNCRYWEQRALLASNSGQDETAYSYARKAVSIQPGEAYGHNTLGTICMRISAKRTDDTGIERYWEAVKELEISRRIGLSEGQEGEHPYMTFFKYSLGAIKLYPRASRRIASEWTSWMRNASESKLFTLDPRRKAILQEFERKWISLAVSR